MSAGAWCDGAMRSPLRTLALLGLVALMPLGAPPLAAGEPTGTTCDLYALVDPGDAGYLVAYDGLRKGLELAQLPRVCRYDPEPATGGVVGFLERQAADGAVRREAGLPVEPLFAVGDASAAAVLALQTTQPFVMVVERYTASRNPLIPLPDPARGAVVYADLPAERVGQVLRALLGREAVYVKWVMDESPGPAAMAPGLAFAAAAGCTLEVFEQVAPPPPPLDAVLHLRFDQAHAPIVPFEEALAFARSRGLPLITDDRARFGHGAVVVLVARHDLLGRAAADEARKLRADPSYSAKPRAVPGLEVWVDLEAADKQGIALPLPFLARADKLRRGASRGAR